MVYQLSFATIKVLPDNIAEVIVDNNIEITLEMVEELEGFLDKKFTQPFALLVNRINQYSYTFEAMSCMISNALLTAMAVVNYDDTAKDPIHDVLALRAVDKLNVEVFSGLELGWQQAKNWLANQLAQLAK